MKNRILGLLAGFALASVPSQAAPIYLTETGTSYQTPSLSSFSVTGPEMAGMEVFVTFADGTTVQNTWFTLGSAGAAFVENRFALIVSEDTYTAMVWRLTNLSATAITGFRLFGVPGNTLFDRTEPPSSLDYGTPGSAEGRDMLFSDGNLNATVTYSDIVNLTGFDAENDLYASVSVLFAADTPVAGGAVLNFSQDTDLAAVRGSIVTTTVPETSATVILAGFALLGLFSVKRRFA